MIGHTYIQEYFDKVMNAGNLSHAYLFVGPSRVGKHTCAKELAAKLLGATQEKLDVNPDFKHVKRMRDPKTDKLKKNIDVASIRELKHFLEMSTSGYKVAIIEDAHFMGGAASNALLKTLEEPKSKAVIFLTSVSESKLLPTIVSRCQTLFFERLSEEEMRSLATKEGMDTSLVSLAQGLPGQLVRFADGQVADNYKMDQEVFTKLFGLPYYEKLSLVDEYFGDKTDHISARNRLERVLGSWEFLIEQSLYSTIGVSEEKQELCDTAKLIQIYDKLQIAKQELQNNIHPKLLVESILLAIP